MRVVSDVRNVSDVRDMWHERRERCERYSDADNVTSRSGMSDVGGVMSNLEDTTFPNHC